MADEEFDAQDPRYPAARIKEMRTKEGASGPGTKTNKAGIVDDGGSGAENGPKGTTPVLNRKRSPLYDNSRGK